MARALDAEIISVDSVLVYKGMDIGTAKPDLAERGGIPHHLMDILDPAETFSTGQFKTRALRLMAEITARGKIPLLAGGTMLYFNALLYGMDDMPPANLEIRNMLDKERQSKGLDHMYQRLRRIDPESAARIHPNDPQRVQRALEIFVTSGRPMSSYFGRRKQQIPYHLSKLIIAPENRQVLHRLIAQRFHAMLAEGFLDEVEALFRREDLNETLPAIRAVGYRQMWRYLRGELDFSSMTDKAIVATRQMAKRQFTWLRKEQGAVELVSGQNNLLHRALAAINL